MPADAAAVYSIRVGDRLTPIHARSICSVTIVRCLPMLNGLDNTDERYGDCLSTMSYLAPHQWSSPYGNRTSFG
jgi:hypothetical protein